jgi:hypothetical protein
MSDAPNGSGPGTATDDPQVVRAQIADTREALGETVDALVAKTDIKARVPAKVDDRSEKVAAQAHNAVESARQRPLTLATVAALLTVVAAAFLVRRARR